MKNTARRIVLIVTLRLPLILFLLDRKVARTGRILSMVIEVMFFFEMGLTGYSAVA